MKSIVTKGGVYNWINTRENAFIEQYFQKDELLEAEKLSERERYIAQNLVTRGVLDKNVNEGKASYKLNINRCAR
jgi:hypothetical protein